MENEQKITKKTNPILWVILGVVVVFVIVIFLGIKFDFWGKISSNDITLDSLKKDIFSNDYLYVNVSRSLYEGNNLIAEAKEEISYNLHGLSGINLVTDFTAKVYQKIRSVKVRTDYQFPIIQYDPEGLFIEWQKILYRVGGKYAWARSNKNEAYIDNGFVEDQKYYFLPTDQYPTLDFISDLKRQSIKSQKNRDGYQVYTFTPIYTSPSYYGLPDVSEVYVKNGKLGKIIFTYNKEGIEDAMGYFQEENYKYDIEINYSDVPMPSLVSYEIESQYNSDQWRATDFDVCNLSLKNPVSWDSYVINNLADNNTAEDVDFPKPIASLTLYEPYLTTTGDYGVKTISTINCELFANNMASNEKQRYLIDHFETAVPLKNEFNYYFDHQINDKECYTWASLENNNNNETACISDNYLFWINTELRATDSDYKLYKEMLTQTLIF